MKQASTHWGGSTCLPYKVLWQAGLTIKKKKLTDEKF